jgi:hypothetical protein
MPYAHEHHGLRREVRRGAAATLNYWPKVDGANVIVTSATVSTPASGVVITPWPPPPATAAYSRLDITVPAQAELAENVALELTWAGALGAGRGQVVFDVVRNPCGLLVSLNQLVTRRPDALRILRRIGEFLATLNTPATALTPEETAGIIAASARVELQDKLRAAARELASARPSLILDQDRLVRAETALTLAHMYEAVCKDPTGGTDDDSAQARQWRAEFATAWTEMGPLAVDADGDGVTDADLEAPASAIIFTKRV